MPKPLRPATQQGRYRTNPISIASNLPSQQLHTSSLPSQQLLPHNQGLPSQHIPLPSHQAYYPSIATTMQSGLSSQTQNNMSSSSSYPVGGPVQLPQNHYMQPPQAPVSLRASSGAWTPADDATLMSARAQGLNWAPIQASCKNQLQFLNV
jgi:hypothetical protein